MSDTHRALAAALHGAVAADGQVAVPEPPALQASMRTTMTIEEAAQAMGRSPRQTRRLGPRLGGKLVAGRWLVDSEAVQEHLKGKTNGEKRIGADHRGDE
ncbi:hypothetical protein [Mycobacterium sp. MMS18-G62]